jgi:hypothetical protein
MITGGRHLVILVLVAPLLFACATRPATTPGDPVPPEKHTPQVRPADNPTTTGFVVSEEYYRTTFAEVQDVIAALTRIITAGDFDGWLGYLSEDYVQTTSSPAFLAAASSSGVLKKNGIVLHRLRDYFDNVVVRSRIQATLDDIKFVDATHVKAITEIQGSSVILYYLEREDGRWKVAVLRAGQN